MDPKEFAGYCTRAELLTEDKNEAHAYIKGIEVAIRELARQAKISVGEEDISRLVDALWNQRNRLLQE